MTRALRVAFVAPEILPWLAPDGSSAAAAGGAERQQALLARELAKLGVEITFVALDTDGAAGRGGSAGPYRVIRACRPDAGLPVVRFLHPRLTSMWKALGEADADVYYQRCAGMLTGVVGAFCARRRRGFVFASAHETDCDPRTAAISNPRDRALYTLGLRLASAVVAQTDEQRERFRASRGIEAAVVRNAGEPRAERPLSFGARKHALFVAALRPWKRPEWFVEIARRSPGTPFVLAGGDAPKEADTARRVRAAAALLPNVRVVGGLSPAAIAALQREALMLVAPSECEGFPNVTLEAWAAGTPVFAATDPDRCIERSGGGAVASDLDGLALSVAEGLANRDDLAARGERGRRHLAEHHDPARSAADLLAVLERAASLRARPAPAPTRLAGEGVLR